MAKPFIISAHLALKAPSTTNVKAVKAQINNQLKGVVLKADVQFNKAALRGLTSELKGVSTASAAANKTLTAQQKSINRSNQAFKSQTVSIKRSNTALTQQSLLVNAGNSAWGNYTRRLKTVIVSSFAFYRTVQLINDAITKNIQLQSKFVAIGQIRGTSISSDDITKINKEVRSQSVRVGADAGKVAQALVTVEQAGLNANVSLVKLFSELDVNKQVTDVSRLATTYVTLNKIFGVTENGARKAFNQILTTAKTTSADVQGLSEGITILGNTVKSSGGDAAETMALIGIAATHSGRPVNEVARSLNTIITRLQKQSTRNALKEFGINLERVGKNGEHIFVGATEALVKLDAVVSKLKPGDRRRAQIGQAVGGVRRLPVAHAAIAGGPEVALKTAQLLRDAPDQLIRDAGIAAEGTENRLAKLRNEFVNTIATLASNSEIQIFIKTMESLASTILKVISALAPLAPALLAFGATRIPGLKNLIPGTRGTGIAGKRDVNGNFITGTVGKPGTPSLRHRVSSFNQVFNKPKLFSPGQAKPDKKDAGLYKQARAAYDAAIKASHQTSREYFTGQQAVQSGRKLRQEKSVLAGIEQSTFGGTTSPAFVKQQARVDRITKIHEQRDAAYRKAKKDAVRLDGPKLVRDAGVANDNLLAHRKNIDEKQKRREKARNAGRKATRARLRQQRFKTGLGVGGKAAGIAGVALAASGALGEDSTIGAIASGGGGGALTGGFLASAVGGGPLAVGLAALAVGAIGAGNALVALDEKVRNTKFSDILQEFSDKGASKNAADRKVQEEKIAEAFRQRKKGALNQDAGAVGTFFSALGLIGRGIGQVYNPVSALNATFASTDKEAIELANKGKAFGKNAGAGAELSKADVEARDRRVYEFAKASEKEAIGVIETRRQRGDFEGMTGAEFRKETEILGEIFVNANSTYRADYAEQLDAQHRARNASIKVIDAIEFLGDGITQMSSSIFDTTKRIREATVKPLLGPSTSAAGLIRGYDDIGLTGTARQTSSLHKLVNRGYTSKSQAESFRQVGITKEALTKIFASPNLASKYKGDGPTGIGDALRGFGVSDIVANDIQRQISELGVDEFAKLIEDVPGAVEKFTSKFNPLVKTFNDAAVAAANYEKALAQQLSTVFGQRGRTVDAFSNSQSAAAGVTSLQDSFAGTEFGRAGIGNRIAQSAAVGLAGSADVDVLAKNLNALNEAFAKGTDIQQAKLQPIIQSTTEALKKLADGSGRTADTLKRLEEVESARAAKIGIAEGFIGADRKGQRQIIKELLAARKFASGDRDISKIGGAELRLIQAGLKRFGGAVVGRTGETGNKILEGALGKYLGSALKVEDAEIVKLQKEAIIVQKQAAAAALALANYEKTILNNFVNKLHITLKDFLIGLSARIPIGAGIVRNTGGGVPGSGRRDTVPAMLTPGEFVIRKDAASALGPDALNELNNADRFARGGRVRRLDPRRRAERRENYLAGKAERRANWLAERNRRAKKWAFRHHSISKGRRYSGSDRQRIFNRTTAISLKNNPEAGLNLLETLPSTPDVRALRTALKYIRNKGTDKGMPRDVLRDANIAGRNLGIKGFKHGGPVRKVGLQAGMQAGIRADSSSNREGVDTGKFAAAVSSFNSGLQTHIEALNNFPREVNHVATHNVNVTFAGGNTLAEGIQSKLISVVKEMVVGQVDTAIAGLKSEFGMNNG